MKPSQEGQQGFYNFIGFYKYYQKGMQKLIDEEALIVCDNLKYKANFCSFICQPLVPLYGSLRRSPSALNAKDSQFSYFSIVL